jgi:hypothetical protein
MSDGKKVMKREPTEQELFCVCFILKLLTYLTNQNIVIMKKLFSAKKTLLILGALMFCSVVFAQNNKASRPSPPATASGKIKDANVTINYSSPAVKGRKIWGDLVPYDKAWRAGANEATIFTTDKALEVEGQKLPAGKYSLFAIPGEKEWSFIFNSETGQWGIKNTGEANFDPAKTVLTVKAKPKKSDKFQERLTYEIEKKGFELKWENLEVPVSIK